MTEPTKSALTPEDVGFLRLLNCYDHDQAFVPTDADGRSRGARLAKLGLVVEEPCDGPMLGYQRSRAGDALLAVEDILEEHIGEIIRTQGIGGESDRCVRLRERIRGALETSTPVAGGSGA